MTTCHLISDRARAKVRRGHRMGAAVIITVALISQIVACHQDTAPTSQTFMLPAQEQLQRRASAQDVATRETRASRAERVRPVSSFVRHSKQSEEEDGFNMKTPQQRPQQQQEAGATAAHQHDEASELSERIVGEDVTTLAAASQQVEVTTTSPPLVVDDDDRIAINATRQQFLTHDQLLNASTRDEQIAQQQQQESHSSGTRTYGMPRLAFASSFLSGKCLTSGQGFFHESSRV